jgi:hypothetical protein
MNRYLAIVPAHNEVGAVAATVTEIHRAAPDFDVLVIDDGSTDGTADAARAAGARVVSLPFNLGIGGAVQCGYIFAREHGYAVAVQIDGDGQHDARDIPRLLAALEQEPATRIVIGSRFLPGADGDRSSRFRRVGIRVFAFVVSLLTWQRVSDPTSGLRMTDRAGIELFAAHYASDYPEVDAIVLAHRQRLAVRELAVSMRPRASGDSRIVGAVPFYYLVKVLLAVFVSALRASPPANIAQSELPPEAPA